jgi:DNA modification methylase
MGFEMRCAKVLQYSPRTIAPGTTRSATCRKQWRERLIENQSRLWNELRSLGDQPRCHLSPNATYIHDDAIHWLSELPSNSVQAMVTDPPYGLVEYEEANLAKRRSGRGGVWRIPPAFDGVERSPLPRFTVLSADEVRRLHSFFSAIAFGALRVLVPGGHLFIASNPLLSTITFYAFQSAGFEKRGEVIRQVQTLRGGDRPKGAEHDFPEVSVMARSCWEPWGIFRKPIEGTVAENLRKWGAGALRRPSADEPLKDVIACSPTRGVEKRIAPHPSLKPQRFVRQIVRAALPLGIGVVYDPFAGSGSTLAAAEAVGYCSLGTDREIEYLEMCRTAFPDLVTLPV